MKVNPLCFYSFLGSASKIAGCVYGDLESCRIAEMPSSFDLGYTYFV